MTKYLIMQTIALLNITEYKTEVLKEKRDDCVKALKEQLGLCGVVSSACICEENAKGKMISGWCSKHHTDWM